MRVGVGEDVIGEDARVNDDVEVLGEVPSVDIQEVRNETVITNKKNLNINMIQSL